MRKPLWQVGLHEGAVHDRSHQLQEREVPLGQLHPRALPLGERPNLALDAAEQGA